MVPAAELEGDTQPGSDVQPHDAIPPSDEENGGGGGGSDIQHCDAVSLGEGEDGGDGEPLMSGGNDDVIELPNQEQSGGGEPFLQWTLETVQTPEMERVGIAINTTSRVIICIDCRSVVKPKALHHHLNYIHHPLTATRDFCSGLAREYDIPDVPLRPRSIRAAIFGLLLFSGYNSCNDCGAAFETEKSILRHIRENPECASASYEERPAQIYFPGSRRMFFGVTTPPAPLTDGPEDPVELIKKRYSPQPFHTIPITSAPSFRDANNFLREEKWDQYVNGISGGTIQEIVRERAPKLREEVMPVVEAYARCMVEELSATDHAIKVAIGDYNG